MADGLGLRLASWFVFGIVVPAPRVWVESDVGLRAHERAVWACGSGGDACGADVACGWEFGSSVRGAGPACWRWWACARGRSVAGMASFVGLGVLIVVFWCRPRGAVMCVGADLEPRLCVGAISRVFSGFDDLFLAAFAQWASSG